MLNVFEHVHPLKLYDVQAKDEDVEESDNEEKENDLVKQDEFSSTCRRCGDDINVHYRYCYKCLDDSCEFSLHKFCAEVPSILKHMSHPHRLRLLKSLWPWTCNYCQREYKGGEVCYRCISCQFFVDVNCGLDVDKRKIHHPGHPHPLVSLLIKPILCVCNACGKEHKGVFLQCTTCSNFALHIDCAFLPKKLLIQQATNDVLSHAHPLTLSYSFQRVEQEAKYDPSCRACNGSFKYQENRWIYKCEKCIYYVHLHCATSRTGKGQTVKNFKDVEYPDLLHLPFPNQTYSIPKHLSFKKVGTTNYGAHEVNLQQTNHEHELIVVDKVRIGSTVSKINSNIMCHDPMKKIELLCNGCIRPIMDMPFYKCGTNEDECCNFALHEWCTRLPAKVDNHPGHPQHTLVLMSKGPREFFYCEVCYLHCNGYAYGCVECKFYVDVTCGLMPKNITHKSHPDHLLSIVKEATNSKICHMCRYSVTENRFYGFKDRLSYKCNICDAYIHPECALLLPETIMHAYDKHPMQLSYLPIENHKSEYFCEICEEKLNPHVCFYHCDVCVQSMHSECAPLILCCETETHSMLPRSIYLFLNIKFGSILFTHGHPHPLSFVQGIKSDGECNICAQVLWGRLGT